MRFPRYRVLRKPVSIRKLGTFWLNVGLGTRLNAWVGRAMTKRVQRRAHTRQSTTRTPELYVPTTPAPAGAYGPASLGHTPLPEQHVHVAIRP